MIGITHQKRRPSVGVLSLVLTGMCIGFFFPHVTTQAINHNVDVAIPDFTGNPPEQHPILAPCSRFEDRYETLGFRDTNVREWPEIYHRNVRDVVDEYMEPTELSCEASSYEAFLEPGGALLSLAAGLPTWNDPDVPLSRFDLSRVLLEYLRVYECALMEFDTFLFYDTAKEKFEEEENRTGAPVTFFDFFLSDLVSESAKRADVIKREREVARKTLNRVLTLVSTAERLRPLEAELECMQRYTLDMRNAASLTAEVSACLPRIWNAKDVLRDYKEDEDE